MRWSRGCGNWRGASRGNQIAIHREKTVQDAFAAAGLAVQDEREIERGAEGSRYAIYWLEKSVTLPSA